MHVALQRIDGAPVIFPVDRKYGIERNEQNLIACRRVGRAPERHELDALTWAGIDMGNTRSALDYAREKRERKRLDAVVVNDISRSDIGFDVPDNEVIIVTAEREHRVPRTSKSHVAAVVLDEVERLRAAGVRTASSREGVDGTVGATAGRAARV